MIINHKEKWVFISIPKNATHSLTKCLRRDFGGRPVGGFHYYEVPERAKNYFKFMCLRNPYDRAISAYFGLQQNKTLSVDNKDVFFDCDDPTDIYKLFQWAIDLGEREVRTGWLRSQYHYVRLIDKVDMFLDCNRLLFDFDNLPFVNGKIYRLPRLNVSQHKYYKHFLDDRKLVDLINVMYKNDFEHLNFKRL